MGWDAGVGMSGVQQQQQEEEEEEKRGAEWSMHACNAMVPCVISILGGSAGEQVRSGYVFQRRCWFVDIGRVGEAEYGMGSI